MVSRRLRAAVALACIADRLAVSALGQWNNRGRIRITLEDSVATAAGLDVAAVSDAQLEYAEWIVDGKRRRNA